MAPLTTDSLRFPPPGPQEYTIKVSAELAAEYADWRLLPERTEAKVITRPDGTADVLMRTLGEP